MKIPPQNLLFEGEASVNVKSLRSMLTQAVGGVFSKILGVEASPAALGEGSSTDCACPFSYFDKNHRIVVGAVGFLGSVSGGVYLYIQEHLARDVSAALFRTATDDLNQQEIGTVNDALGEICNMTAGSFRQQLSDVGHDCRLTVPSVTWGGHFSVETSADTTRCSCPFKVKDDVFVVDIFLKNN